MRAFRHQATRRDVHILGECAACTLVCRQIRLRAGELGVTYPHLYRLEIVHPIMPWDHTQKVAWAKGKQIVPARGSLRLSHP